MADLLCHIEVFLITGCNSVVEAQVGCLSILTRRRKNVSSMDTQDSNRMAR